LRPVAKYDLLIDGQSRWKAGSDDEVSEWLREYREEHAEDDPDAAHVQIRRLGRLSWLTGGSIVPAAPFLQR
jgi:hypothetical protein